MLEYIVIGGLIVALIVVLLKNRDLKKLQTTEVEIKVQNNQLRDTNRYLQSDVLELQEQLGQEREKNRTLLSQKKSSETRLGQISEHLVPFLANCPYDPKNLHFLGNPIDYVSFDFDAGAITFIEVKSGNSKPSKRQKIIKNLIKNGNVYYDEIRINERGVKIKNYKNADGSIADDLDVDEGEETDGED